jgi:hypothetical protein
MPFLPKNLVFFLPLADAGDDIMCVNILEKPAITIKESRNVGCFKM